VGGFKNGVHEFIREVPTWITMAVICIVIFLCGTDLWYVYWREVEAKLIEACTNKGRRNAFDKGFIKKDGQNCSTKNIKS